MRDFVCSSIEVVFHQEMTFQPVVRLQGAFASNWRVEAITAKVCSLDSC